MTETMLAAVVFEHGGYEKLTVTHVPKPQLLEPDDVIVRVRACALNHLDIFARKGTTGPAMRKKRLPAISGVDVAGEVEAVGTAVKEWRPGDRVVLYPVLSCGHCPACQRGEETMCSTYRIFGEDVDGGLAEYCRIKASNLEALPEHIAFEHAAAIPAAYTTAWRMLFTAGGLEPTESVLVIGASGGVGSAAVILARWRGAQVFAVTSGAEKLQKLQTVGANRVIDRTTEDVEAVIQSATDGQGVDMVINPVGGRTWRSGIRSLAIGGRMMICGAGAGDNPDISIREIYQLHRRVIGAPMGNRADFRAVLNLVYRGEIEPLVGTVLPLNQIALGHQLLEEGKALGKVVITGAGNEASFPQSEL